MEWEEHRDADVVVIHLRGEVDLQHSPKLRTVLQGKVAEKVPALLLDMSEVKYIDSSGLATLVEDYQHARNFDGRMALAGATQRVKSVFDLVRLNEIFEFYPTVQAAQSGLRAAR